jgi:hypothetical protein
VRETWRRLVVTWNAFRAAILRIPMAAMDEVLARFLAHLGRTSDRHRVRRIDVFLNMIREKCG